MLELPESRQGRNLHHTINAVCIGAECLSRYSGTSLATPLYYGQFTCSLRDQNPYKAYFSKTDTSIMQTLIPVPLVSIIERFNCNESSRRKKNDHLESSVNYTSPVLFQSNQIRRDFKLSTTMTEMNHLGDE